jgi:acetyltransferase-like isoleucine patch superfamily enzyme
MNKPNAKIHIGEGSAFSGTVICAATSVEIGQRVMIGANSKIMDTDFHPVSAQARREHPTRGAVTKPVCIGDDVWIGMNVIILPGTTLGSGCVVSAGAVVSGVFPPDTVLVGNPARPIKKLETVKV